MKILVTGAAGFIGSNLVKKLCEANTEDQVIGIDNMNDYYDVRLKEQRLKDLEQYIGFTFIKGNIADKALINDVFDKYQPQIVVNLAAQAGVRYSITNPDAYIEANLIGFYNILEACRHHEVEHLVYASSSSVYGSNKKVPYSTDDKVDNPVSLYAATKKSNELMAHAYSKLYNIPSTGLRFFTVYGPAGRPDMAYFGFTNKLIKGETIQTDDQISIPEAMDVMIRWFCILFGNQFTPDEVLDYYPVDRLMHDIALALMAVQTQTTGVLDEFPTKAAQTDMTAPA